MTVDGSDAAESAGVRPVVLVVIGHYLPGWKAGGQVATAAAAIEQLGATYDFRVMCLDRDLGDGAPYAGISPHAWQPVGKARVCYLPADCLRRWWQQPAAQGLKYDLVWLHGLFGTPTVTTLVRRRLPAFEPAPVIIVPHGELSGGALSVKRAKKALYLALSRSLGLYRSLWWQVSGPSEAADVTRVFPRLPPERIRIVRNPSGPVHVATTQAGDHAASRPKIPGRVRLAFLSRISPKKNLDVALRLLHEADGQVDFDIFGPIDDDKHWARCQELARTLPDHVRVTYRGPVEPASVRSTLNAYHALLLPTRGENFGYAILEALQAGCLPLISDTTPWRDLEAARAGWDIPLSDLSRFGAVLRRLLAMDDDEFHEWSTSAASLGQAAAADPDPIGRLRMLFSDALRQAESSDCTR